MTGAAAFKLRKRQKIKVTKKTESLSYEKYHTRNLCLQKSFGESDIYNLRRKALRKINSLQELPVYPFLMTIRQNGQQKIGQAKKKSHLKKATGHGPKIIAANFVWEQLKNSK